MRNQLPLNFPREVASVACSAAISLVGAWVLVMVAGTVAFFAVLLVGCFYVPLRCRSFA